MIKTIVLIDDHPIVREGLANLLNAVGSYKVVGESGTAPEGLEAIRALKPDVALVDLMLNNSLALGLIEQSTQECPNTKVICVSMHSDAAYAQPVALAGASGYINKANASKTILDAIDVVLRGELYFPKEVHQNFLDSVRGVKSASTQLMALSSREIEILQWIGHGLTKHQIAERINRSANTVEAHRSNIKRKLGLQSNAELIRFAALNLPSASV
ncbi:response regulator transcription factor [Paraburkholderia silvatlantica]|nr:response regulator transcription factor [Paraburkholderia silvatlantica]